MPITIDANSPFFCGLTLNVNKSSLAAAQTCSVTWRLSGRNKGKGKCKQTRFNWFSLLSTPSHLFIQTALWVNRTINNLLNSKAFKYWSAWRLLTFIICCLLFCFLPALFTATCASHERKEGRKEERKSVVYYSASLMFSCFERCKQAGRQAALLDVRVPFPVFELCAIVYLLSRSFEFASLCLSTTTTTTSKNRPNYFVMPRREQSIVNDVKKGDSRDNQQ